MIYTFKSARIIASLAVFSSVVSLHLVHATTLGAPTGLMTELLAQPELTVIASESPHLSWIVNDLSRGAAQTAYQVQVQKLDHGTVQDVVFDSGKVVSSSSSSNALSGLHLVSDAQYQWRVRTWNNAGEVSDYSTAQSFKTGKLLANAEEPDVSPLNKDFSNRYPLQIDRIKPVSIITKGNGSYFIDFGRAAFGTILLKVKVDHTDQIAIRIGEVLLPNKIQINQKPGKARRFAALKLEVSSGDKEYLLKLPNDPYNTRDAAVHVQPGVHQVFPFRYCEIDNYPGILTADDITQSVVHYHFNDQAASFQSSDQVLNAVWELCHYSMKATSYLGCYIDGDRERTAYEADAYINQLGHYSVDREYTLDRHSYQFLLKHPTWPVEWQQHMVFMAWADYLYTGDIAPLKENYEALSAKTLQGLARSDGLISASPKYQTPEFKKSISFYAPLRIVLDWPYPERDGHQVTEIDSVANAFYYRSLVLMAQIADVLGKTEDSALWRNKAVHVSKIYEQVFYNPKTGLYRDGEGVGHSSMHATMFALAFGLVPEDRRQRLSTFVASKGMACSVYASQYLIQSLFENHKDTEALALLTSTSKRSWYNMIRVGSTISMEAWDDSFKPNEDWNHAWGAAPANLVPRYVLGIRPLKSAFSEFTLDPRLGSLSHLEMVLPTIKGSISARVSQTAERWNLSVNIPANTCAHVYIPCTEVGLISESNHPLSLSTEIEDAGVEQGKRVLLVKSGQYSFSCPR